MNKSKVEYNLKNHEFRDNEDSSIIDFFDELTKKKEEIQLLEVGSGMCRFVKKISKLYDNISISCLEINPSTADIAKKEGFVVYNENFLDNTIPSNFYDIVHCSHVIEHFKYPEIINVIDELLRITKKNGYLIIRSPLMWNHFYDDIDHIRPYPPESILNYLNNPQQQKQGKNQVEVIRIWYRTIAKECKKINRENYLYCLTPIRKIINELIGWQNKLNIKLWNRFRWPASKPNGYVMILKKIQ